MRVTLEDLQEGIRMCTSEVMERLQNQKQNLKMKQYFAGWSTAVICSRSDINSFE